MNSRKATTAALTRTVLAIASALVLTSGVGLADATTVDMEHASLDWILQACRGSVAVAKIEVLPNGVAASRDWVRRCERERTNPKAAPCFIVRAATCLKGKCPRMRAGFDLRQLGIDVTDYIYLKNQVVYVMWKQVETAPDWGVALTAIDPKTIADRCN